jgi:hypothetical protein
MRRIAASLTIIAALMVVAVPVPVAAAPPPWSSAHDQVVAYWTKDRLTAAVPRDIVLMATANLPQTDRLAAPVAAAASVGGAQWTKGGLILKASGKVYFHAGAGDYMCSGAVAQDARSGFSLVLTAAHCAYDWGIKGFVTNWVFIPDWQSSPVGFPPSCDTAAWGCWTAQALVVNKAFAIAGSYNGTAAVNDFAFAVVGPGGKPSAQPQVQLDATVGSFPIAFSGVKNGNTLYAFGYPASAKYGNGNLLGYCSGPIFQDLLQLFRTWGMNCDLTGGASGGPWLSGFSETTGSGTLASINTYVYSGRSAIYGPKFNATTQAVYNAANTATTNTLVP